MPLRPLTTGLARSLHQPISRRMLVRGAALGGLALTLPVHRGFAAQGTPGPVAGSSVTIDLPSEPPSLDPAIVYDANGWSVIHSIYDSLLQYGPDGVLEPLLAESFTLLDPLTYEVKLRQGITFHNGEPVDAKAVAFSVAHLQDETIASQVRQNFLVIDTVEEVDPLTIRLVLTAPAPWMPAQIAAWLAILPPVHAATDAFPNTPVGSGPYRFVAWDQGQSISLEANPDSFPTSPKGQPIAAQVNYRFVPDGSTRVADLLAGSANLIANLPVDAVAAVEDEDHQVIAAPVAGLAYIRLPTDVAPFTDVRVRQALNLAVDVDGIIAALLGGEGQRLANFFVPDGLGHDPTLPPYPYDPDRARALLAEASLPDGFETTLEYAASEREDVVAAIAGQLAEIGVQATIQAVDPAVFNQTWNDPATAPMRFATWRPLFDPYTLLSLIVSDTGFLSRHANPAAQALIDAGANEADEPTRARIYRDLGQVLHDEPAAIYLYRLTAFYGLDENVPDWTPRSDEYVIATRRS